MLEFYFKYPRVLRRLRSGALGEEMDRVAAHLSGIGYKPTSAKVYISRLDRFSQFAARYAQAGPIDPSPPVAGLIDFLDAEPLSRQDDGNVDLLAVHADAAAAVTRTSLSWSGYRPPACLGRAVTRANRLRPAPSCRACSATLQMKGSATSNVTSSTATIYL